jgi:hypothetical protein
MARLVEKKIRVHFGLAQPESTEAAPSSPPDNVTPMAEKRRSGKT